MKFINLKYIFNNEYDVYIIKKIQIDINNLDLFVNNYTDVNRYFNNIIDSDDINQLKIHYNRLLKEIDKEKNHYIKDNFYSGVKLDWKNSYINQLNKVIECRGKRKDLINYKYRFKGIKKIAHDFYEILL